MSDVLTYLTSNTGTFPLKQILFATAPNSLKTQIKGHIIKEVKVIKTCKKNLPIPIKVMIKKSPERSKSRKRLSSPLSSPVHSPKSLSACKTISPKLIKPDLNSKSPLKKEKVPSPRRDIKKILKNALKQEKDSRKAEKIKIIEESKQKLNKRLQMKVFDEFIRQENLQKFKQRLPLSRPKWGNKKEERKVKEVLQKNLRRGSISINCLNKGKKNGKKEKIAEFASDTQDFRDLRLKNYRTEVLAKLVRVSRRAVVKRVMEMFKEYCPGKSQSKSGSIHSEDIEVQQIMLNPKSLQSHHSKVSEIDKFNEKILQNQFKMKIIQQQQLTSLKSKDLQEMNKLAEILGNESEMKGKFQEMIDRRYSKLENLFEENLENIKQVLGLDLQSLDLSLEEMVEKAKPSDLSSSFLNQIEEVPSQDLILSDPHTRSPTEENFSELLVFKSKNFPLNSEINEEEPLIPLISESLIIESFKENSEEAAFNLMVQDIKAPNLSDRVSEGTMELKNEVIKSNNPILILDASSSSSNEPDPTFSTIVVNQIVELEFPTFEESKDEKVQNEILEISEFGQGGKISKSSREIRPFTENFPKIDLVSSYFDPSTETEGLCLIIQRILFTLESDILSLVINDLAQDEEFFFNLHQKSSILIRSLTIGLDGQIETDPKSILSLVRKMQELKSKEFIMASISKIFDPVSILSEIQENFEEVSDEVYIFEYLDIDLIEFSLDSSCDESSVKSNPYMKTHCKAVVDAVNEALIKTAKKFIGKSWRICEKPELIEYEKLFDACKRKIETWARVEAGKIPSVEMVNSFGVIDEDKLQAIRQDNLAKMLVVDNDEEASAWVDCDFEETQAAIDVCEWIFNELLWETAEFLGLPSRFK